MILDALVIINILLNIITITVVTYIIMKLQSLTETVFSFPTKSEIINEIITTKIPITMGPDGVPMVVPPNTIKGNPLVG